MTTEPQLPPSEPIVDDVAGVEGGDPQVEIVDGQVVPRLGYRRQLDGLRGVAILMVMVGHSWPRLVGGGLGVDIFFALSGFLITTLILEEVGRHRGSFAYKFFYVRRALRLFPALYAMLLVFSIYAAIRWSHLEPLMAQAGGHRSDLPGFFFGAATYTTNLLGLAGKPGNLFGHTWSLAVEEQFYLIWPVILVGALRRSWVKQLMWVLVVFVALTFLFRAGGIGPLTGFLGNRPDAIAFGCLAALGRRYVPASRELIARHGGALALVSLALIGACALCEEIVVSSVVYDRGLRSIIGLAAAVLVWSLVEAPDSFISGLLKWRLLVEVGLISYGLYVWHQPIFRVIAWEMRSQSQAVALVLKWVISVGAALASFWVVERPARNLQKNFRVR